MKKNSILKNVIKIGASIVCLSLSSPFAYSQDEGSSSPSQGESKEQIAARLKDNVVREKNGDVYIRPFPRMLADSSMFMTAYNRAFYSYIDPSINFADIKKRASALDYTSTISIFEKYFYGKKILYKRIPAKDDFFRRFLDDGILISFLLRVDVGSEKEIFDLISERSIKRAGFSDAAKWSNEISSHANESKKALRKFKKGEGAVFSYLTGYNQKTNEYQVVMQVRTDADKLYDGIWITRAELDVLSKFISVPFRSFEF